MTSVHVTLRAVRLHEGREVGELSLRRGCYGWGRPRMSYEMCQDSGEDTASLPKWHEPHPG